MIDQIFTPNDLAINLVQHYSLKTLPFSIADFAVGEGSLIYAAHRYWPNAQYIVNDIDQTVLSKIHLPHAKIESFNNDFLTSDFKTLYKTIDLIVLNPPFSHANRKNYQWNVNDISSGIALFFIYRALKYLSPIGQILAILPNGCFNTERDQKGLKFIEENYTIERFEIKNSRIFTNARPNTSIVRISPKLSNAHHISNNLKENKRSDPSFNIFRGNVQLHKIYKSGITPLFHTTSLNSFNNLPIKHIESNLKKIKGRMILLPRVGNFNKEHIVNFYSKENIHLSDCLFAIECKNYDQAEKLKTNILRDWDNFIKNYNGSGAKFITKKRLENYLSDLCTYPS